MHKHSLPKLLLIPLLFFIAFTAHADNTFSRVYVFGDSLSDTGNLGSITGGIPTPYYNNRISNGPIAVDTLASELGDTANASLHLLFLNEGHNYSVAGAKASTNEFIDLNNQIIAFQTNNASVAPQDALYVIFIGGNDVRSAIRETDDIIADSIIHTANNNIKEAITSLKQMGARTFLIINVPNIALLPETKRIAATSDNPNFLKRAKKLSTKYNRILHHKVEQLKEDKKIKLTEFNLFKLFSRTVKHAKKLGFTNNTDACFLPQIPDFHPDCNFSLNADKFIFFDEIHPTTQVHTLFGEAFIKAFNNSRYNEDETEEENKDKVHF